MQLSVGAAIRDRRKARRWDQRTLGQRAGVNAETVNRAEMGANVTIDTLLKITRALDSELELILRDPQGQIQSVRDAPLTHPVSVPSQTVLAPGEDSVLSSLPQSPSHIALYGIIGELDPDQAKALRKPLEELIERLQNTPPEPEKPAKKSR